MYLTELTFKIHSFLVHINLLNLIVSVILFCLLLGNWRDEKFQLEMTVGSWGTSC